MELSITVHHYFHSEPPGPATAAILAALADLKTTLTTLGAQLMTQEEDLQAVLKEINDKLDGVGSAVTTVGGEVTDLLARLEAHPAATDLTEEIAAARAIAEKVGGIQTQLAGIPSAPPAA